MTKTLLTSISFSGFFSIAIGQTSNLILTNEQNNKWLDSLSTLSFDNKLRMINERLLSDTNIFIMKYYPDRIKASDQFGNSQIGNRVSGAGKPMIMVNQSALIIDNKTQNTRIIALTQLLDTDNIADIKILKGTAAETLALYGSSGKSGVIIMRLTKNKYISKFKKLKLTSNYW